MIAREKYAERIENAFKFVPIVVLIGARQVGKTTLMNNYEYHKTYAKLHGQDAEVIQLFSKYTDIESYLKININKHLDGYLLIDEFQFIPNISTTLKLLVDNNSQLKIIVSGSSSIDILQKVEESLAGRVRVINVYSLSFSEYIRFYDETLYQEFLKYDINTPSVVINKEITRLLNEFLVYGGMPRVALAHKPEDKFELLNDIYQTYLLRDVKSFVKNEDSVGFNKLLRLVAAQTANLANINELSKSSNLSYKKTSDYLYLLEQMFIIKSLEPYASNAKKGITKMKKLFFYDTGMRNMVYNSFNDMDIRLDAGAIFENYVYLELLKYAKSSVTINFFRTRDQAEIDFIWSDFKQLHSLEVKYKNLLKPLNIKVLNQFNETESVDNSYVINNTLNEELNGVRHLPSILIKHIL